MHSIVPLWISLELVRKSVERVHCWADVVCTAFQELLARAWDKRAVVTWHTVQRKLKCNDPRRNFRGESDLVSQRGRRSWKKCPRSKKKRVLDALIKVNLRERRLSRVKVSAIHSRGFHVAFNVNSMRMAARFFLSKLLLLLIQLHFSMHNYF